MDTHLIVPINVAALAVGQPDATGAPFLSPMGDFSQLPWAASAQVHNPGPYTSAAALTDAEPFEGEMALPAGIHIHWALPDGLTAGAAGADGLSFPAAPNRWLVTRVVVATPAGEPATTSIASWVVESDALNDAQTAPAGLLQPTVPVALQQPGAQTFAYLGEVFDLSGWSERGSAVPRLTPFTAVGYGHPAFAAFYPNSSTVFGYYDDLTSLTGYDPATSTISYQVTGWYSDAADDPLQQAGVTPSSYGWAAPTGTAPTATLCAGVIDAIPWNSDTTYLGQTPQALTVALGPSSREAVSALMAGVLAKSDPGQYANAEQVLNALQFGLLSGSDNQVGSLAAFEEAVHAAGFATLPAGPLWTVTAAGSGGADGTEVTLPDALAEQLNALNVAQVQGNDAAFAIQAMQFQLFSDWYKYQMVQHAPNSVPTGLRGKAVQEVIQYVESSVTAITTAQTSLVALTGTNGTIAKLSAALSAALPTGLTLTPDTQAPRYYQPADPVLVLSGADVTPTDRYGFDAANGPLPCRTDSGVVTAIALAAGLVSGSSAATLAATALPQLAAEPCPLAQELLAEAFFLSPGLQPTVATAVAAAGGAGNPATTDFAGTVTALAAAATAFLAASTPVSVTFAGTAPDPRYYDGWTGTPWLPMLMQYDVQFAPVQYLDPTSGATSYPADFINGQFAFDPDGIELVYGGALPTTMQDYQGTAILTPNAVVDLQSQIASFVANVGADDELQAVLDDLQKLPLLAQGLTGLSDAFLMRALTLQMPIGDPLVPAPLQHIATDVAAVIGDGVRTAPLPENSFNPIRSGLFTLGKVRLIDVFGRYKDYASPDVVVAKALAPPSGLSSAPASSAFLPPRLTQPSRLLFRWRAADDRAVETNASPATTPVFGWVVPDYLDDAIEIYAAAGTALGTLALSADRTKVLWTPAPGGANAIGTPIDTVFAGENADLAAFATGIYNDGDATFFGPFFAAIRSALTFALPKAFAQSAAQAVLAGQPLALARASLALDTAGPLATDESWTSFQNIVLNGATPDDAGVGQVSFPVTLGAPDELDDTLVGYWIAPAAAADYRTFFAPSATAAQGGVAPPAQATLVLEPQPGGAGSTDVVLLLDPRGCVHATTGILPTKSIDIPPVQYADAIAGLALTLPVMPVLSGSNLPATGGAAPMTMVQPKVSAGAWSWVTVDGTAWATTGLTDVATAQATLNYTPQQVAEGWLSLSGATTAPSGP